MKLADGKARTIQHMMVTSFWHSDGTPISAQQFMEMLFGKLPDFFKNEAELRALWSSPDTRAKLLQGLAEKGFGSDQMAEMQKIIDADAAKAATEVEPWVSDFYDKERKLWSEHGELISLPADEQASMMKMLVAVGAEVAKRKPGLQKPYDVFAAAAKRTAK